MSISGNETETSERRGIGSYAAFFLYGFAAAGVVICQREALLFPALLVPDLQHAALAGGVTGLLTGVWAGRAILPGGRPGKTLSITGAFLPAILISAAGLLGRGPVPFLEMLCRTDGVDVRIPFALPSLLFAVCLVMPAMLGILIRIRFTAALDMSGSRTTLASVMAGGAAGTVFFSLLTCSTFGLAPALQLLAFFLFLICFYSRSPSKSHDLSTNTGPARRTGPRHNSLSANLDSFLFFWGAGLFLFFLNGLAEKHWASPCSSEACITGLSLFAASAGLFLGHRTGRSDNASAHSFTRNLLSGTTPIFCAAALAPLMEDACSASLYDALTVALLSAVPFGFFAGLLLGNRPLEQLAQGLFGTWAGMGAAFCFSCYMFDQPVMRATVLASGTVPLVVLVFVRNRTAPGIKAGGLTGFGSVVGILVLGMSFLVCDGFWFSSAQERHLTAFGSSENHRSSGSPAWPGPKALHAKSRRMASISVLLHPEPEDTLVIGPEENTNILEIAKDLMVKSITVVGPDRRDTGIESLLKESKRIKCRNIHEINAPARLFLRHSSARFDLVYLPPPSRKTACSRALHTREFYCEARDILKNNGIFCQWIFPHELSHESFVRLLGTVNEVFPGFHLFIDNRVSARPALALVSTHQEFVVSAEHTENRMFITGVLDEFVKIGLEPEMFAILSVTNGEMLEARIPPQRFSDGCGYLSFSWPEMMKRDLLTNLRFINQLQAVSCPWFKIERLPPRPNKAIKRHVFGVCMAGKALQQATIKGIEEDGAGFPGDAGHAAGISMSQAMLLARGLTTAPEYRYLLNLLNEKVYELMNAKRFDDCRMLIEECIRNAPDQTLFHLKMAELFMDEGKIAKAADTLENTHHKVRQDWRTFVSVAVIRAKMGNRCMARILLLHIATHPYLCLGENLSWVIRALEIVNGAPPAPHPHRFDPRYAEEDLPRILRDFVLDGNG